ncbi:hypothetical protein EBO15_27535 [Actinomadura harenae]|uniref:Uncharacterized protein n=1 Tax=Actinomadura harenae TaxID=2483351 RepID=A0A3M2LRU2_9ACTN|nr:hypothetical protein EBO15_27535 [Actinomadura harenae]
MPNAVRSVVMRVVSRAAKVAATWAVVDSGTSRGLSKAWWTVLARRAACWVGGSAAGVGPGAEEALGGGLVGVAGLGRGEVVAEHAAVSWVRGRSSRAAAAV